MQILLASHNLNKVKELQMIIGNDKLKIISLKDLNDLDDPLENGKSYLQNSYIKAKYYYDKYKLPVLADDSGLSVSYLKGKPGIHSKRFSEGDDKIGITKVLKALETTTNRKAQFVCHLTFIYNDEAHHFKGYLKGSISNKPSGDAGFGYDPIFIPLYESKTLAQLGNEYKNKHSHRARAYEKFVKHFEKNEEKYD